jgi:hypothetical protein
MNRRWITGAVSGAILMLLLLLLLLRPSVFVYPLWEQPYIPLGNLLFSLAFIAFPVFLNIASLAFSVPFLRLRSYIGKGFTLAVILGVLWWPVAYMLAGNFSNNFQQQAAFVGSLEASRLFWVYTYFIVFFSIFLWLLRIVLTLAGSVHRR